MGVSGAAHSATRPAHGNQERAERTKARVVQEMVACVVEEGFAAASARRVAERAGVTWGVVQYHFGDRDGILAAVIEAGYAELLASLASLAPVESGACLARSRIEQIVDLAWQAFSTDLSRAAFEILVATRQDRDPRIQLRLREVGREVHALGARLTGNAAVGEVLWSALRGMVLTRMMTGAALDTRAERQALVALIANRTKSQ